MRLVLARFIIIFQKKLSEISRVKYDKLHRRQRAHRRIRGSAGKQAGFSEHLTPFQSGEHCAVFVYNSGLSGKKNIQVGSRHSFLNKQFIRIVSAQLHKKRQILQRVRVKLVEQLYAAQKGINFFSYQLGRLPLRLSVLCFDQLSLDRDSITLLRFFTLKANQSGTAPAFEFHPGHSLLRGKQRVDRGAASRLQETFRHGKNFHEFLHQEQAGLFILPGGQREVTDSEFLSHLIERAGICFCYDKNNIAKFFHSGTEGNDGGRLSALNRTVRYK